MIPIPIGDTRLRFDRLIDFQLCEFGRNNKHIIEIVEIVDGLHGLLIQPLTKGRPYIATLLRLYDQAQYRYHYTIITDGTELYETFGLAIIEPTIIINKYDKITILNKIKRSLTI